MINEMSIRVSLVMLGYSTDSKHSIIRREMHEMNMRASLVILGDSTVSICSILRMEMPVMKKVNTRFFSSLNSSILNLCKRGMIVSSSKKTNFRTFVNSVVDGTLMLWIVAKTSC